ncbi:murein L,D-transpeptidase [Candidatus Saccharibacteria bacterium]|nr:murein L,D-transpeptidase [Candidatus Saccharibacteria bacterium]
MENKEFFCPCEIYTSHKPYGHWLNDTKKQERKQDVKKLAKALIEVAIIIAIIIGIFGLLSSFSVAKAESYLDEYTVGFPSFWQHDATVVTSLQESLVLYGENVEIDGKFGPKTGQAVKNLQKKYGLNPNGIVDDTFAWMFQVQGWPFNTGYTMYYMANLELIYQNSDYEDLIYITLGGRGYDPSNPEATGSHLWLFRDGKLIADSACITGNESKGYFTPLGTRHITGRKDEEVGKYSTYYYLLHLNEKIYIHSLLEYFEPEKRDHQVLGAHMSDGSIRVPKDFAEWLYENMPDGVTVVIDDRAFSPYGAPGYEHLLEEESPFAEYVDWEHQFIRYGEEL